MLQEFKKFVFRGNVIDLAVGIIIGAAFGKIVSSLVADILMPPIGMILGKVDFSQLYINLSGTHYDSFADAKKAGAATINYGSFVNATIDFVIVAFVIFMLVRFANRFKAEEVAAEPVTKACPECLSNIPLAAKKCAFCTSTVAA